MSFSASFSTTDASGNPITETWYGSASGEFTGGTSATHSTFVNATGTVSECVPGFCETSGWPNSYFGFDIGAANQIACNATLGFDAPYGPGLGLSVSLPLAATVGSIVGSASVPFQGGTAQLYWNLQPSAAGASCQAFIPLPPRGNSWYQLDPAWSNDVYDSVTGPKNTIRYQGCALTALGAALSAVGQIVDPGSLNNVLDGIPGAYSTPISNKPGTGGRIDFPSAVTGASNGSLWFDWSHNNQSSTQALDSYLCAQPSKPVIVSVMNARTGHTHYVLVTGKNGNTYSIIDPGYSPVKSLNSYGNQFSVIGVVKRASGDPSALAFTVVDTASLLVKAPDGSETGLDPVSGKTLKGSVQSAYLEQDNSVDTDVDTSNPTSTTHSVDFSFPQNGTYYVQVLGLASGLYQLSTNAFDQYGTHEGYILKPGFARKGSVSTFQVQFSSVPGTRTTVTRTASFTSLLADIANGYAGGFIDNAGVANALSAKISAASEASMAGDSTATSAILNAFETEVRAQSGKHVSGVAADILQEDAEWLLSQLH